MPRRQVPLTHPAKLAWVGWCSDYTGKSRRAQGRSDKTRELDRLQLDRLTRWAVSERLEVRDFTTDHAARFIAELDGRLTPRGVNMCRQVCRSFGDFLVSEGMWTENAFRAATIGKRREVRDRRPQGLTPEELEKLLATPNRGTAHGLRDYLYIHPMAFSGLRSGEVCYLRLSDLHLDSCRVRVAGETAKTRTERWPWLPHDRSSRGKRTVKQEFAEPLAQWLLIREGIGLGRDAPFFCNVSRHPGHRDQGTPLGTHQMQQALARYGKRAGTEKHIHPHMLRHTAGYLMGRAGMSVDEIMDQLGHVSVSMALHYSKGTDEDTEDSFAAANTSGRIRVPTRKRAKVLQSRKLADKRRVLQLLGITAEDLRELVSEDEE